MPCYSPDIRGNDKVKKSDIVKWKDSDTPIIKQKETRGINTEGREIDYLTSLLCTHLRYLAEHLKYTDFVRLVEPDILRWFEEHCKNEN